MANIANLINKHLTTSANIHARPEKLSETERSDAQFFCSLFPASELASRPCHSWLDPNNCIHTTEGAITTNGTNVITYKRNTLHYIRCYGRSLLQKERLLQKDQCLNLQKVHFVLQKDTPRGCHHLPVCRIRRRHGCENHVFLVSSNKGEILSL